MKKIFFLPTAILITISTYAQTSDMDKDGIADSKDKCPSTSSLFTAALEKMAQQLQSKDSKVTFLSSKLKPTTKTVLLNNKLVVMLAKKESGWELSFLQQ